MKQVTFCSNYFNAIKKGSLIIIFTEITVKCEETTTTYVGLPETSCDTELSFELYTKNGDRKKRKKFKVSLNERKNIKQKKIVSNHRVKEPCNVDKCKKKCIANICSEQRNIINSQYWAMNAKQKKK